MLYRSMLFEVFMYLSKCVDTIDDNDNEQREQRAVYAAMTREPE